MKIYDELIARGLIAQVTDEKEIRELVNEGKATFYIGFDPTADSLHVGHFMALCLMKRLQMAGNKPIALVGGGTGMIGDPTGRTDLRKMMTTETIDYNCECFKKQMSRFSFLEFNYMLMQSYDFLKLYEEYGCNLEFGGDDQWSNMLGGRELIRKKLGKEDAHAMTITLLLNSEGKKMGKTGNGAVWLDPNKTSPFEFYQYWRNVDDKDVLNCIRMLTFLPIEEINENMPKTELEDGDFKEDGSIDLMGILVKAGLATSRSDARRAIEQGGVTVNDEKISDIYKIYTKEFIGNTEVIIRKGKKSFKKIIIK